LVTSSLQYVAPFSVVRVAPPQIYVIDVLGAGVVVAVMLVFAELDVLKVFIVLVVLKVALRNSPKPTMIIIAMTMSADTPSETALFALAIVRR
ncbi:MAG: hypothetical protein PXY39_10765, partial [archaeon]|nr:hypothetical protein [archaeon]